MYLNLVQNLIRLSTIFLLQWLRARITLIKQFFVISVFLYQLTDETSLLKFYQHLIHIHNNSELKFKIIIDFLV